jgi:DNA helicase HerA-like ATPase
VTESSGIYIGKGQTDIFLSPALANRHGLIAGATGTGKTVTLQILSEGFSDIGVPVFMADVKGDLAGISTPGSANSKLEERANSIGMQDYSYRGFPAILWDLFGEQGHPIRTTVSDMGPLLLSRLLDLNDTQEGVMNIAFKLADDEGLLLLDFKDLRSMINFVGKNAKELTIQYGNVSSASIGAIQRRLLVLEQQGGENFFGEPALDLNDLMRTDPSGRGYINILAADKLMMNPKLYSTFLLWLLAELFEQLPEVGDPEKPRLVFFFDEAHLLFDDAPKALINKVEQVVRLIRSKGVGVYFVTQNPMDVPNDVLGQLGNRVQHSLRAFTPRDKKAVKAAADTFRANPDFDASEVITRLGVGHALVSTLEKKGVPGIVQETTIRPPCSRMGPISTAERQSLLEGPMRGRYDKPVDRLSAHELLLERAKKKALESERLEEEAEREKREQKKSSGRKSNRQGVGEAMLKSLVRSIGSGLGRKIVRGLLGSLLK